MSADVSRCGSHHETYTSTRILRALPGAYRAAVLLLVTIMGFVRSTCGHQSAYIATSENAEVDIRTRRAVGLSLG